MAQAESQPAPGQPEGRRRPQRPGRQERHAPQDGHAPRGDHAPQERPCAPDRSPDAGVRLEHPVVVGYDGSESARHALAYGAGMARRLNRPLLIVHVCPAGVYCEPMTGQVVGVQRDRGELERWLVAEFDEVADRAGLKVCVLTRRGSPARELAATAEEQGADALVIGAPTRFWHQVAGSVPGWLARHARCPVMVVP
jgi:nucleotide-binding universal stress UspA family protein